jgi:hypothetical protein
MLCLVFQKRDRPVTLSGRESGWVQIEVLSHAGRVCRSFCLESPTWRHSTCELLVSAILSVRRNVAFHDRVRPRVFPPTSGALGRTSSGIAVVKSGETLRQGSEGVRGESVSRLAAKMDWRKGVIQRGGAGAVHTSRLRRFVAALVAGA